MIVYIEVVDYKDQVGTALTKHILAQTHFCNML